MFATLSSPLFLTAWASGTATGLGLFAVVGAQSAFILRQGLMRAHLLSVVAICALIDAVFIFASVSGLQALTSWFPWLTTAVLWFGVAFLSWYALQSARRAWTATGGLAAARDVVPSRRAAMLGALGFSLLNPHFWLDMVVVGSLAHGFDDARMAFAAGAFTASLLWLAVLGIGSRLFARFFASASAWRVLDGVIAVVMAGLAVSLAIKGV
nr:LysE family transporter [uncultured Achromobacter sp.]